MGELAKILAAIFSSAGLSEWFFEWLDKRKKRKAYEKVLDNVSIYDSMNKIINHSNIQRVMIFRLDQSHLIGRSAYVYCIKEAFSSPFKGEKQDYQNYPVDETYIRMVQTLYQEDLVIHTDTMPEGVLKDIYTAYGIKYSLVSRLCDGKIADGEHVLPVIFYISLASSLGYEEDGEHGTISSSQTKVLIRAELNKIRNLYMKYYS